jgi:hypothetical protein
MPPRRFRGLCPIKTRAEVSCVEQFDLALHGAYDELLIWNFLVEMSLYGESA